MKPNTTILKLVAGPEERKWTEANRQFDLTHAALRTPAWWLGLEPAKTIEKCACFGGTRVCDACGRPTQREER